MAEASTQTPTVLVIGGGYGGINVAKALDEVADVVLVEPRDAFHHNVASLRALVDPSWLPQIFLPYDGLLANGRVIRDRAVQVDSRGAVLASGKRVDADYIVLASGSRYPFPAKSSAFDSSDAQLRYRASHAELAGAARVLLVGAGPVGIELAGEIRSHFPDKAVILTDLADEVLAGPYSDSLRGEVRRQLAAAGVELELGSRLLAEPPSEPGQRAPFEVATEDGRTLSADIWYRCYGVTPVTDYLADDLATARQPDGFLRVRPDLRLTGQTNVFVVGDISAADRNMAGIAARQAELAAGNIKALIAGSTELVAWEPAPVAILLPIGPEGGSGQLPGSAELLSPEQTASIKGRDMLIDRYADLLGTKLPARTASASL